VHPQLRSSSILARALVLAAGSALLGLGTAALRPGGLRLSRPAPAASCEAPAVEPSLLAPAEAAQLCASERALIADARSSSDFAGGHIAGAVHLPCDATGALSGPAFQHLEDRSLVLVYGTTTDEAMAVARSIARHLPAAGAPKVYALSGGFSAWERAGLACASGPCEGCAASPEHSSSHGP